MVLRNGHLESIDSTDQATNAWVGKLVFFRANCNPLDTDGQKRFLDFVVGYKPIKVREVAIHLVPNVNRIVAELVIISDSYEAAIDDSLTASMKGLHSAGLAVPDLWPQSLHIAWLMELSEARDDDSLTNERHDAYDLPLTKSVISRNMHTILDAA
jgi:hypothetical protein